MAGFKFTALVPILSDSIESVSVMKYPGLCAVVVLWAASLCPAWAGQYVLVADQPNTVPVAVRVENGEPACNVEITVQGQPPFDREVRAPHYETRVVITPQDVEQVTVSWRGKPRRVHEAVFNACPTMGQTQFSVVSGLGQNRANWDVLFASFSAEKTDCVRTAFRVEGVRPDNFDLNDRQVSREDWKIHRAMTQCDVLVAQKKAWGEQNPKAYACTLGSGLKTQCEGYYTASINGKVQAVSYDTAVQLHLNGVPVGSGVREVPAAQTARVRRVQAEKARVLADAAAKAQAEQDARVQAIRQAEEARLAAIKAKRDKEAADYAEKIAVIERVEREEKAKRNWLRKKLDQIKEGKPAEPAEDKEGKSEGKDAAKEAPKEGGKADAKASPAKAEVKPEPQAAPAEAKTEPKTEAKPAAQ